MNEEPPLDLVALVARKWLTVAICVVLGSAAGVAYAFMAPSWYAARLTVIPSQQTTNPAIGLLGNLPGAEAFGASSAADVQRIQAVLTSNSVADEVIAKFDLNTRYGTKYIEHTRAALWTHCSVTADRRSSVVALVCEDQDPEHAKSITTYFGEVGNKVFGRISASSAREERRFLETQVVKARKDVDEASRMLREFQQKYRVVDLGEQSKAVISAMASIKGDLVAKQLQLSYLASFSSRTEANVVQLEQQIRIMEAKLKQLEDSGPLLEVPVVASAQGSAEPKDPNAKFFPDAMRVPELRFELEQLYREQKIQETVFFLMTQRHETAKVDEARDTSTFQILDTPTLPTFRHRPQRKRIAMYGAIGGLALAGVVIILPVWLRRRLRARTTDNPVTS